MTSIAVLNIGSGQSRSFSMHQTAEQMRINPPDITDRYDQIEQSMLGEFFEHVRNRPDDHWMHWNMRDSNFGFPAIEHRFSVLGGEPAQIPESRLFNLADALVDIYGDRYIQHGDHGRLESLMHKNSFQPTDFLTGAEEAEAFVNGQYVILHLSTLRKARTIGAIAERAHERRLSTEADIWQRHGANVWGMLDDLLDHTVAKFALFVIGLIGFALTLLAIF